MAEEDERAKDEFRELYLKAAQYTEKSAIDHIMSFAHTEHEIARDRDDFDRNGDNAACLRKQ